MNLTERVKLQTEGGMEAHMQELGNSAAPTHPVGAGRADSYIPMGEATFYFEMDVLSTGPKSKPIRTL